MSVLCKRLRDLAISNNSVLYITSRPRFSKFLDNYLKFHYNNLEIIQRFKLHIKYYGAVGETDRINGWLRTILNRCKFIKEMDICIKHNYCLNGRDLLNSKSLTVLKLEYVKLKALCPVSLPSLKAAFFTNVHMYDNHTLQNLLLGCRLIEDLILDRCLVPNNIDMVSDSNLKSFEIRNQFLLFKDLKEGFLLRNSHIENLRLDSCRLLQSLNIQCQMLKVLVLCGCGDEYKDEAINIDTPNLVSFTIEGWKTLPSNFSITAPNLSEASIKLVESNNYDINWFVGLLYFLRNFKDFKGRLNLEAQEREALLIPRQLRSIIDVCPLPNLKHLNIRAPCWTSNPEWREVLLFLSSPSLETLSVDGNLVSYLDFAMTS
ncbi:putative F-box/FBD/LRR-repeat protein At5g62970 [Ziziphus jujuba]|uniref:F-box/FBD/LRR-repeat protein At5g62970 n=2 Tax=Ziziphus jujuba TaxID=326968 RepID=A0A6P3ZMQ7_ZIZJJ|nr:putative F-box/FBD/LRR-repeat protein At5g62970 [Ziziphus jujuba]KAH7533986.1 hypothetical protein FEM48_Zijuj04G0189900 [Ziziphus jujuba var. spinosa]